MAIRFSYNTGAFEIGRYRGAPVYLSPMFFFTGMALALPFWRSFDLRGLFLAAGFIAILFASILIHELAHAVMATRYRVGIKRIDIHMLGGLVQFRGLPHTMRQDFLITLAGPLSNLVLGLAAFALLQATAGYLMAYVYASTGSYRSLFALGCTALALGTLLVAFSRPKTAPAQI